MIAPLLVIFACTNVNRVCDVTLQQYYREHPEFKTSVDTATNKLEKTVGPKAMHDLAVLYALVIQNTGVVDLGKGFTVTANPNSQLLMWRKTW